MKNSCLLILAGLISLTTAAQDAEKAKVILDELSAKTKTYTTVNASFDYTLENKADGINEKQEGSLITKKDKYYLTIGGQELISDGKTLWTYLVDAGEVQITSVPTAEEREEEEYISPTTIFTLYEKGFKYKYVREDPVNGKIIQLINLFPNNPDERSYHTIKLYIDKQAKEIYKIKIMGKEGTTYTYSIKSFKVNENIPDTKFTFNKAAYPDLEIIDLR